MSSAHTPTPWFLFGNGHCIGGQATPAGVALFSMAARTPEENAANAARAIACVNFVGEDFSNDELQPGGYERYIIEQGLLKGALQGALHELLERARDLADHCDKLRDGRQPFGVAFDAKVSLVQATIKRVDEAFGEQLRTTAELSAQLDVPATATLTGSPA